jgi:hypothetical protein
MTIPPIGNGFIGNIIVYAVGFEGGKSVCAFLREALSSTGFLSD